MKTNSGKNVLTALMVVSFAAAMGTFINGLFAVLGTGGKDPAVTRMFIISACFFSAGVILRRVLQREN